MSETLTDMTDTEADATESVEAGEVEAPSSYTSETTAVRRRSASGSRCATGLVS